MTEYRKYRYSLEKITDEEMLDELSRPIIGTPDHNITNEALRRILKYLMELKKGPVSI
jgi:hypothetical protein